MNNSSKTPFVVSFCLFHSSFQNTSKGLRIIKRTFYKRKEKRYSCRILETLLSTSVKLSILVMLIYSLIRTGLWRDMTKLSDFCTAS